jgi:trans-aconitate methyltransferase
MKRRENWNHVADVWEQRAAALAGRPDPYATIAINALPLDDEWSILDIGCGPGVTTVRLAERAGPDAVVTGVDVSPQMILHARNRRHAAIMRGEITPHNIRLRVADAERDDLGTGHDAVFSRFGVMFFDDAHTAFSNLASTLKLAGWLSVVVWADAEHNPWMALPVTAAAKHLDTSLDAVDPSAPGPFTLADRDATVDLLTATGFDRVSVIDITQPRRIRHGEARAWAAIALRIGPARDAFLAASPEQQDAVVDALVADLDRYKQAGPTGDWLLPAHARAFVARRA